MLLEELQKSNVTTLSKNENFIIKRSFSISVSLVTNLVGGGQSYIDKFKSYIIQRNRWTYDPDVRGKWLLTVSLENCTSRANTVKVLLTVWSFLLLCGFLIPCM